MCICFYIFSLAATLDSFWLEPDFYSVKVFLIVPFLTSKNLKYYKSTLIAFFCYLRYWKLVRSPACLHLSLASTCCLHQIVIPQSTHRVPMATFWRTFHHDGKIIPAWWGWGCTPTPLSLYLPSRTKLWCTIQLRGQIHYYFYSTPICTLWAILCETPVQTKVNAVTTSYCAPPRHKLNGK